MANLVRDLLRFALVILAIAAPASAAPSPSLKALVDGVDEGRAGPVITFSELTTDVRLHGHMAEIAIEARITNPSNEIVEARFALTLPDEAVVTGYALDIDGAMIEGVLVDQPKARAVYEDEVRKGIDPGLAEVTAGNVFQTRVYPIAAEGSRTIRVRFVAPVDPARGLVLPLETESPVIRAAFRVEAGGFEVAPSVTLPVAGSLVLRKEGAVWRGALDGVAGKTLRGALTISGPTVDPMLVSRHANGDHFFQIADSAVTKTASPTPARVRIYWDSSRSRRDQPLSDERALLSAYLEAVKPQAIDVVSFSTGAPQVARFGDPAAAVTHIAGLTYRGGTSFRGLDEVPLDPADLCLLFSDGAPTIDTDASFRPDCRLSIVSAAPEASGARLGRMALATRGQVLRLTGDNRAALVERLRRPAIAVVAATDNGGRRLPFRALPAQDGGWFVVGRMPDSGGVHLRIAGIGRGIAERIYSAELRTDARSDAAGALWASAEVAELADNPLQRERMRTVALHYSVASPTMAFLVLERPDQYLTADIKPPAGYSRDWIADYQKQRRRHEAETKEERAERLAFVLEQWTARKAWWATRFDPPKRVRKAKSAEHEPEALPPPPPPPPPPPLSSPPSPVIAPAPSSDQMNEANDVIVTASRRDTSVQDVPVAITAISARDESGATVALEMEDVLSDQPYLKALDAAAPADRAAVLAAQEKMFGTLPAFYLETSEWFRLKGDAALAEALLLSALELPITDDETRFVVAFRLQRAGALDPAIGMLELIAATTDYRPQPKRSLALALAERGGGRGAAGRGDLERAFELLTAVALDPANNRYDGIETVALMEANALVPAIEAAGGQWTLDPRLVALLDTDVRIVIEWTDGGSDIDLHVVEPTGEEVYYSHQKSLTGGLISNDMTDGYGPEEYVIHRAVAGAYEVRIDGYASDRLNPNGNGRVMVRLISDFGRKAARQDLVDADIAFKGGDGKNRLIATLKVEKPKR